MSRLVALLMVAACLVAGDSETDYCNFSPNHQLCMNKGEGAACGALLEKGFTKSQQEEMVKVHNELRSKVATGMETQGAPGPQPSAGDMLQLSWDAELAEVAQRHASQCVFDHDCNECRKVGRFSVGQNLWMGSNTVDTSGPPSRNAINSFFSEVKDFSHQTVQNYQFSSGTGHYTQLVWASTNKIGCGYAKWKEGQFFHKLITCNYGPAGNFMNRPMYKVVAAGQSCSACPSGTSCSGSHEGLCQGEGEGSSATKVNESMAATLALVITALLFMK